MGRGWEGRKVQVAPEVNAACKAQFEKADKNGDGQMDPEEIKASLKEAGVPEEDVELMLTNMIANIDKDGDGKISLKEFVDWWNQEFPAL